LFVWQCSAKPVALALIQAQEMATYPGSTVAHTTQLVNTC